MNSSQEKALDVISALTEKPKAALKPETELVSELGIDSPRALQLLVELEESTGAEISDEEAARMETVGDVLDFFAAR